MKRKASSNFFDKEQTSSGFLFPDLVRLIFVFVGPEDTLWNCRRVCKDWKEISQNETLAQTWMDINRWNQDWRNDNSRIKNHNNLYPLWTYCFNRVTVRKFFQKCLQTIRNLWFFEPPCSSEKLTADWNNFHESFSDWKLPWEVYEFYCVIGEIYLKRDVPFCIHFYYDLTEPYIWINEGCHWDRMSYNKPDTHKWVVIGEEAEYSVIMVCCEPDHVNFGQIATAVNNCGYGQAVALSLVELMRGLYWQHQLMEEFYGIGHLKKVKKHFWSGSGSFTEGNSFDYFRSVAGWTDNSGHGKKELPAIRERYPDEFPKAQREAEDSSTVI